MAVACGGPGREAHVIELKSASEVEAMREAGRVVAATLAAVREQARVGVPMVELEELARTVIGAAGASPVFPGSHPRWASGPYPGVVCVSVNDAVVRGIAGPGKIRDGDLVGLDCGARLDGWCAAAAVTFPVGRAHEEDLRLVEITEQSLADGIAAAQPDARVGDVSRAVGIVGRSAGYGIPAPLGGHGLGRDAHEAPFVPNDGPPGAGAPLRPGMVLVLGPVFVAGGDESLQVGPDGWTLWTGEGGRAAHAGHTVAITEAGPQVLTAL